MNTGIELIFDSTLIPAIHNLNGGIRIQQVPKNEKKNRTHTSTVTVAVMSNDISVDSKYDQISDDDFKIEWFSGTGAGGQHRNKCMNSCRLIHIPTGIVEARQSRSRSANLQDAKNAILDTLARAKSTSANAIVSKDKQSKFGSGMRGDKIMTIQFQNNKVTHHVTGKTCRVKDFISGKFIDLLT